MSKKSLVAIGISGGVDSAVAALLLKQQGYQVIGIFMQNWNQDDPTCLALIDLADAKSVCDKLKIELTIVNFASEYWHKVFQHFLDEYAKGRTPNPDILCNQEIKFKAFLNFAKTLGADYIATGHYAIRKTTENNEHYLFQGADQNKDQSYFLYTLTQEQLAHSLFPLGEFKKPTIRKIAQDFGLPNYAKKDSTGICFIGERKFRKFLQEYLLTKPGEIITSNNRVIGKHIGLMFYTIGQRHGLGIGGQKHASAAPWYVAAKNIQDNTLVVTQDKNYPTLMRLNLTCRTPHWISGAPPSSPYICQAKIRYRQNNQDCTLTKLKTDTWQVNFSTPAWAIAPGQSVVFYQDTLCLGGAIID